MGTSRGSMIYIAYLKRALRIAAQEALSNVITASEAEYETRIRQRVNEWIQQAQAECRQNRPPAKEVPRPKPPTKKFPRSEAQIEADETWDKMTASAS